MEESSFIYRHILLPNTATVERYTSPKSGQRGPFKTPPRDRFRHSEHLLRQLEETRQEALQLSQERTAFGVTAEDGMCLSFESDPGFELKLDSLESARSGIELLTVRKIDEHQWATVFVPAGKQTYFIKKVEDYRDKSTGKTKNPQNQPLVGSISDIRKATLEGLWTDERKLLPGMEENIWWEVWLRKGTDGFINIESFKQFAPRTGLRIGEGEISFPERSILLVFGNIAQMTRSLDLLNCIAEVRKAKDNPEIFMRMTPHEQAEWVSEASERIRPALVDDVSVCILDTGINRSHPLIEGSLANADMHAYDPAWGTSDHHGHGSEMAGLALYGDLVELFTGNMPVQLSHCLESVKILPPAGYEDNDPRLYGDITRECVARAEITAPYRKRIVSMAVTAPDFRDSGRPSSWSAAIDQMTSGAEDHQRRLLVLSAGNTDYDFRHLYPQNNITEAVHDPGQAWNALCVGAYTEKTEIDPKEYPGWRPIALAGDLSPSSCCSFTWQSLWPIKPDIVLEGGNDAINPGTGRADVVDSLQLLTTNWRPASRLLTVTGETSAATALASRMAAIIQAEYPEFWPETVRALMVHSADWTTVMKSRFSPLSNRGNILRLLQLYGYGVPHLTSALKSAANSLTLIVQNELQPYDRIDGQYKTRDIHIHELPWPVDALESLAADTQVEMRVTLSYFIEPNPAERGWRTKHTYHSHGLRFDVKTPTEDIGQFRWRVNRAARDEEDHIDSKSDASEWDLGPQLRSRGSLHSDRWHGTAAALAQRECLAVFPVNGWWKARHHLERWNRSARYSLIVTISTPEMNVDLYTPVLNRIAVETRV